MDLIVEEPVAEAEDFTMSRINDPALQAPTFSNQPGSRLSNDFKQMIDEIEGLVSAGQPQSRLVDEGVTRREFYPDGGRDNQVLP